MARVIEEEENAAKVPLPDASDDETDHAGDEVCTCVPTLLHLYRVITCAVVFGVHSRHFCLNA